MKNTRFTSILGSSFIACALTIGSLVSTQYASAQSGTPLAKVNIPFAFQVGTQTLPAGMYQIDRESGHLVLLRGPGQAAGFVDMHDAIRFRAAAQGTVVFDRYGDKYYLRQIWAAGSTDGLECAKSRAEKESVQAKNQPAPDLTEVAFSSVPQH